MTSSFTGIVLAGGKSKRLGKNKAFIQLGGKPVIQWVLDALRELCDELLISANEVELYSGLGVRVIRDAPMGKGALVGLYSALIEMRNDFAFVAACDMPFLSRALLSYMMSHARDCDALVPRVGEYIDPLHAIYSRKCVAAIKKQIALGNKQVRSFYGDIKVEYVDKEIIYKLDPGGLSLFNINSSADLDKARTLIAGRDGDILHNPCDAININRPLICDIKEK